MRESSGRTKWKPRFAEPAGKKNRWMIFQVRCELEREFLLASVTVSIANRVLPKEATQSKKRIGTE
jgi:hypothetical protein